MFNTTLYDGLAEDGTTTTRDIATPIVNNSITSPSVFDPSQYELIPKYNPDEDDRSSVKHHDGQL